MHMSVIIDGEKNDKKSDQWKKINKKKTKKKKVKRRSQINETNESVFVYV